MPLTSAQLAAFDLDKPVSQADFGDIVGLSQQHVSRLVKAGTLAEGDTLGAWIDAYTARLRAMAEERLRQSSPELQRERRGLLLARTEGLRMANNARRAELAPVAAMDRVLQLASRRIAPILAGIAPALRAELPELQRDPAGSAAVEAVVGRAVAVVLGMRLAAPGEDEETDLGERARDCEDTEHEQG